ncbi:hypothetical protein B9Z55_015348 [Caenorhabditis nigoni]|uniref:Saposin B-type domain-containing protein n=1 Tax=Caenorhabditis nigoni TaxID=1611254 RepID=A0A2G5UA20_9PELO|nr:hypothetical protein B9Z55_015348 [Caenorhabditis nigoni]
MLKLAISFGRTFARVSETRFCDLVVDEYLPQFIQELDAILADPHQVCVDIKACNAGQGFKARKYVGVLGWFQRNSF